VVPEVMVPLIATKAEFDLVKERIDAMAQAVAKERGTKIDYQVGTMIELPRAALMAARSPNRRSSSRSAPMISPKQHSASAVTTRRASSAPIRRAVSSRVTRS